MNSHPPPPPQQMQAALGQKMQSLSLAPVPHNQNGNDYGQQAFHNRQPPFPNQQPGPANQRPGFPSQPPPAPNQQPGPPNQRPAFPNQQPAFPSQPLPPLNQQPALLSQPPPASNQQPGFPSQPLPPSNQQPGFPSQPPLVSNQQPGFTNQQPGFPSQPPPASNQQPGFPNQQPGFPSQPPSASNQQPGFPSQPPPVSNQPPGFPNQQPGFPNQQPGFPSQPPLASNQRPAFPNQQPGFPSQPPLASNQPPGLPNQPPGFPNQQPGFPGPQPGFPGQHAGSPGGQQPGFPPQRPPFPGPQQQQPQQPPGFPNRAPPGPQQPGYAGSPPGFAGQPPRPAFPAQQPSFPGQRPPAYPNRPPGYQNQQPGYPGYPGQEDQYGYQSQQSQKKLNPDQMPSPIQLMTDDQNANGGVFATSVKGRVPPLVTTDFVVVDQGNASPRYIRSSMYSVPVNSEMMKQVAVPFCVVISPMAEQAPEEQPPPLLDYSALTGVPGTGPVRCSRCKAYMCPAMRFVDAGRHFQCAFCKATTEVPMEYTQYLNNAQQYGQGTPEMSLGCYEIVATKEYCRNNVLPNPPAMIFVIDVSYNAVRSGMVQLVVGKLRTMLSSLQTPPRIGIITYSSTIHFYNINANLGQPQMLVVGDINDVFVPFSHGLLAEPGQADHLLDALSQQIPLMFRDNKETETILLPAVKAGMEALKAAECTGKLLVFHCALPTAQAPGQLQNRDDRKLLGTDKEKSILNPQTKIYNEVAQECVGVGCGIELFLFNNSYVDLATIGQLARLTGGGVFKYTYFQSEFDGDRVLKDLTRVLSRPTAYDAVMRVRTSTGVRATDFYGHFFMSNTTDVELATLDSDKSIAVEIKHDDKLNGEDGVYIQVALLYTHVSGQRRLRICNLSLELAPLLEDLYRSCELDTFINFLTKQAISRLSEHSPKQIKEGIIARCAQTLACYRKHCASPSSVGQLVLPESMKLLPLYANCLLRSDALSGGPDISCDDRSWAMQAALCADVSTSVVMLYPRLLCISPLARGIPAEPMRCSIDRLRDDSIFLLENSVHMMMWIGLQSPPDAIKSLFGVNTVAEVNTEVTELPALQTDFNESVRELIDQIRAQRRRCMRLTLVRQHDKLEMVFRHFLVEDDGRNGAFSYMDFLCHLHKEIRVLL